MYVLNNRFTKFQDNCQYILNSKLNDMGREFLVILRSKDDKVSALYRNQNGDSEVRFEQDQRPRQLWETWHGDLFSHKLIVAEGHRPDILM